MIICLPNYPPIICVHTYFYRCDNVFCGELKEKHTGIYFCAYFGVDLSVKTTPSIVRIYSGIYKVKNCTLIELKNLTTCFGSHHKKLQVHLPVLIGSENGASEYWPSSVSARSAK